ncbi:MAG: response regulator transcription factor [Candidatus Promineifilaceae bacterium]
MSETDPEITRERGATNEPPTEPSGERPVILVVDDEIEIRTMLRLTLTRAGFDVREAADGTAALSRITEYCPDLVLLDVLMPGKDGYAVCRELRGNPDMAELPILMFSARTDSRSRQAGLDAGATAYLTKPMRPDELVRAISDALSDSNG